MASTKMKLGVLKKSSPTSVSKTISKEASPDSKCPICLDQFKNISYVDKCLHRFCFRCIHEWSKNKAECPLCKQPFSSIYHSIKAEDDFKQYDLRPSENGSFGSLAGQRFRYRTTLTGDRRPGRRTSPPPDHGVMFEGLSGSVSRGNDRGFRRMLARLAARHQAQGEGRTLRTLQEQEMIRFRRTLYRRGLRVRGVRDGGRSRETSAEFFRGNPACLHRLVPWLKRELLVLYGTHGSLVNIVQHIVMSQITRYNMQDPAVLQELRPFLLSRTEHFLHEFQSFAQSPFNMEAYDQNAVYDCPAPSAEENSSSDSSIITVSEDEADLPRAAQTGSAMLSQTPWDDETPGPSYSTDSPRVFTVSVNSSDSDSEEEAGPSTAPTAPARAVEDEGRRRSSSGEEDCVIVGYIKPTADRTPELVQLSSDSEEEEGEEGEIENSRPSQPQHIRFTSPPDSPDSPSSSQSAVREKSASSSSRNKPHEQSHDHHPPTPGRSSKNDHRRHKSKRKDRSRSASRNSSSTGHRRRSRSKDRRHSKEVSSYYGSYHSCERGTGGRYYTHAHYSSLHVNLENHTHSRTRLRERSRASSRERSRARSRESYRAKARDRYRARSRDRSSARSRDCSLACSQDSCRAHSRDCSRACSRDRSRARSRSRSRSRSWSKRHSKNSRNSSPSSSHRKSRHVKASGKRKYKSLHLEPSTAEASDAPAREERRREKNERRRRSSSSVEIVYEDESGKQLRRKHKKRKKHKKKSRRRRSKEKRDRKSPTVITISESDSDDGHRSDAAARTDSARTPNVLLGENQSGDSKSALHMSDNVNEANTTSIAPSSPAHLSEMSRTSSDPAEPSPLTTSTVQSQTAGSVLQPVEQNTSAFAGHGSADDAERDQT